jgi:hypothetical protein
MPIIHHCQRKSSNLPSPMQCTASCDRSVGNQ